MAFQRRFWIVERAAWATFAVVVILALAGLLSHGPLSQTTKTSESGSVSVTYERLERRQALSRFTLRTSVDHPGGELALRFGPAFLDTYQLRSITPEPVRSTSPSGGYEGVWALPASGELRVQFAARATRFGFAGFDIEAPQRGRIEIRQFIFP